MKIFLIIRPKAAQEIAEIFEWYDSERRGLGHDFLEAVQTALHQI